MHGPGAQVLHQGDLAIQGGIDLGGDDGFSPAGVVALEARSLGLADQELDQRRLSCRRAAQHAELAQGGVQGEVGRDHALGGVGLLAVEVLVQHHGEGAQPVEIGLRVRRRPDLVLVVQEVGDLLVGARQLAEDIGREAVADAAEGEAVAAVDLGLQLVADGVEIDLRRGTEGRPVDAAQRFQMRPVAGQDPGLGRGGAVVQPAPHRGAVADVEAQGGGALGRVGQVLVEEALQQPVQRRVGRTRGRLRARDRRKRRGGGHGRAGREEISAVHVGVSQPFARSPPRPFPWPGRGGRQPWSGRIRRLKPPGAAA